MSDGLRAEEILRAIRKAVADGRLVVAEDGSVLGEIKLPHRPVAPDDYIVRANDPS